jgi:hypothetical protein
MFQKTRPNRCTFLDPLELTRMKNILNTIRSPNVKQRWRSHLAKAPIRASSLTTPLVLMTTTLDFLHALAVARKVLTAHVLV